MQHVSCGIRTQRFVLTRRLLPVANPTTCYCGVPSTLAEELRLSPQQEAGGDLGLRRSGDVKWKACLCRCEINTSGCVTRNGSMGAKEKRRGGSKSQTYVESKTLQSSASSTNRDGWRGGCREEPLYSVKSVLSQVSIIRKAFLMPCSLKVCCPFQALYKLQK